MLPGWYVDAGPLSLYYAASRLMPGKTRAFVDFIVERFRTRKLAAALSAL